MSLNQNAIEKFYKEDSLSNRNEIDNYDFTKTIMTKWISERQKNENLPRKFKGIYPADEIKQDSEQLRLLKMKYKFKELSTGPALEYCLLEGIKYDGWFENEAIVSQTSEYDDFINGIDLAISLPIRDKNGQITEYVNIGILHSAPKLN